MKRLKKNIYFDNIECLRSDIGDSDDNTNDENKKDNGIHFNKDNDSSERAMVIFIINRL